MSSATKYQTREIFKTAHHVRPIRCKAIEVHITRDYPEQTKEDDRDCLIELLMIE